MDSKDQVTNYCAMCEDWARKLEEATSQRDRLLEFVKEEVDLSGCACPPDAEDSDTCWTCRAIRILAEIRDLNSGDLSREAKEGEKQ